MLQRIQAEIGLPGCLRMAVNGNDTAFFAQLIEVQIGHVFLFVVEHIDGRFDHCQCQLLMNWSLVSWLGTSSCNMDSSAPAQISRRSVTVSDTTIWPFKRTSSLRADVTPSGRILQPESSAIARTLS